MNKDVELSRKRVSRRRAMALGGGVSLAGLVAACTGNSSTTGTATTTTAAAAATTSSEDAFLTLLDQAPQCLMTTEGTQGPYWFDVDSIRGDIREDRPGTTFELALRVQDLDNCAADGTANVISNAVVEIWHCDAGGVYSGFESGSTAADIGGNGAPGGMGAPPEGGMGAPPEGGMGTPPDGGPGGDGGGMGGGMGSSGETSDGSYSEGDSESTTTDDGTYLRGAQTTDANGIAKFTTVFPGWYVGRTTHIHLKVHIDKKTVLTSQLFFDDAVKAEIYATSPYSDHAGWESNTQNSNDNIYDDTGLVIVQKSTDGYIGAVNLGISV